MMMMMISSYHAVNKLLLGYKNINLILRRDIITDFFFLHLRNIDNT